ncbi:MAG: adenylosuccinate synthetase [Patescibacteria group bacterium]|nr:adenylosuccinate synthetase [Patescibacteria group bacterium]
MNKNGFLTERIAKLTKNVKTMAVTCLQWGDTGKGKIVDLFSGWADIIVRGTGGANAGHTIVLGLKKFIFHLIPSGIHFDKDGKVNAMGRGMAIDPEIFVSELSLLDKQKISYDNLIVAGNANLTLPVHILLDLANEGGGSKGKIGTTGRGIGPTYVDFYGRRGLTINDLLNKDVFAIKLKRNLDYNLRVLRGYDPVMLKELLFSERLSKGIYYDSQNILNIEAIVSKYVDEYGKRLGGLIRDVDAYIIKNAGKKKILCEGAQGHNLSILHGSYPFVTPSDCSLDGLLAGCGLNRSYLDLALGIIKGFYMTRVGDGPFPTELGGKLSDDWCGGRSSEGKVDRAKELEKYPDVSVDDEDEFRQGMALRRAGDEYGATTGRPRRVGWLDLPLLKSALRWATKDAALTKLDVLNDVEEIKICYAYDYQGSDYRYGDKIIRRGDHLYEAIPAAEVLQYCQPIYNSFPGWQGSLAGVTDYDGLPRQLREIVEYVRNQTDILPRIISTGADREETIFV